MPKTGPKHSPKKLRAVIYVRVSTKGQDTQRQEDDLQKVAAAKGYVLVDVIREKLSGVTKNELRKGLQQLLQLAREQQLDLVMVQEVSRLGRSTSEILKVVEELTALKVDIYVQNFDLHTLNPQGKRNPTAQFMFTMLAEFARMERENLRERIFSGLARARKQGKTLGRPKGSTLSEAELLKKYAKVVREIKSGQSVRKTAKICDVSPDTVQRVKKAMKG